MPFDGIVAKCAAEELNLMLSGGRIEKIFQPDPDEVHLNIRSKSQSFKLLLSASANYPRIHITTSVKENPPVPPVFCMLLRKYLSGGKILSFEFNGYERIISLLVESASELGDISVKKLIIEIMGRHSNIILLNSEDKIIDAIKHVDSDISRVREIMPARQYTLPPSQDKITPDTLNTATFIGDLAECDLPVEKNLLDSIKGFSPLLCREICYRAGIDSRLSGNKISLGELSSLRTNLDQVISDIVKSAFHPSLIFSDEAMTLPLDFHCINITSLQYRKDYPLISTVLDEFYQTKDLVARLKQKQFDLLKVLNSALERCRKKLALQEETLRNVAGREKFRLFGELITANIYRIPKGLKLISLENYYSEDMSLVDIPLDENMSSQDNAQRYFKKYTKAKSTYSYTIVQIEDTRRELDYLESVLQTLDNCSVAQEIAEVRQELSDQGYLARGGKKEGKQKLKGKKANPKKTSGKSREKPSPPLHFVSSDGYDIYVGKNNRQNDTLTKQASSNDIWLHTKDIHGSHVIIRKQQGDVPRTTLTEAAMLAAWHSKGRMSSNVNVDFTNVRNVSKPSGAKPGMVIYEGHKTISVTPDKALVAKLSKN